MSKRSHSKRSIPEPEGQRRRSSTGCSKRPISLVDDGAVSLALNKYLLSERHNNPGFQQVLQDIREVGTVLSRARHEHSAWYLLRELAFKLKRGQVSQLEAFAAHHCIHTVSLSQRDRIIRQRIREGFRPDSIPVRDQVALDVIILGENVPHFRNRIRRLIRAQRSVFSWDGTGPPLFAIPSNFVFFRGPIWLSDNSWDHVNFWGTEEVHEFANTCPRVYLNTRSYKRFDVGLISRIDYLRCLHRT